jgi:KDO2-lipid IV(A) lauroyltransferase
MLFAIFRFTSVLFFRGLGRLLFFCFKKRRKIAIENVERTYSFLAERSKKIHVPKKIIKNSFAMLGQNLSDFLLLRYYTRENIDKYISFKNVHYLEDAINRSNGVIISTAHFGCWELAAHALALKNFKSVILYNKFKKPAWLDLAVKKQREYSGNTLILKKKSFISLYRHLKNGGIVTLMTDQHAVPPEGLKASFLGQSAWTHSTFAKMSLKTGAPIIPAYMFVDGYSKYTIEFFPPIEPSVYKHHEVGAKACNEALEKAVVRSPASWMWQHRRFKVLSLITSAITSTLFVSLFSCASLCAKEFVTTSMKVPICRSEAIYKSSLKLSIDDPSVSIVKWRVLSDPVEEYVIPLKSRNEIYKNSLAIELLIQKEKEVKSADCYVSCFVIEDEVRIVPYLKKIRLGWNNVDRSRKKNFFKKFTLPQKEAFAFIQKNKKDLPNRFLKTRFLLVLFLLFLFLGFVVVRVLSFGDIVGFLGLGSWLFFGRLLIPFPIVLIIAAICLFMLSVSFSTRGRVIYSAISIICAAFVLPLLVEAYLLSYVG